MIDIKLVRDYPDLVKAVCKHKQAALTAADIDRLVKLDADRRQLQDQADELRRQRNELAAVSKTGKPTAVQVTKGKQLKAKLATLEAKLEAIDQDYLSLLKQIPNFPATDVPIGASEVDNVVVRTVGNKPQFSFPPQTHWQLGEQRGWIDKRRAAKVAGARFAYLKGDLVRLQFALIQFALDILTDEAKLATIIHGANLHVSAKPFVPVLPPAMVRTDIYEATARLSSKDTTYKLADDELWLNASAEHSLVPMYAGEILPEAELPIRYAGFTTAFRREAGSYGKDMEGILRLHQFDKLELESFTTAETGLDEHFFLIAIQEYLMQQLELPYQVVMKCTADIGKPNARGVDLEAWLPGQDNYRETHTADYMTDYQARRLATRVRRDSGQIQLVHTNDATAFAAGRLMVAILENNQTADGEVTIPAALQRYFGDDSL